MPPPDPPTPDNRHRFAWFGRGHDLLTAKLSAIDQARRTIVLETYIFANDATGRAFRGALVRAARRAVEVRVLVDAFGSRALPEDFFSALTQPGGQIKRFNAGHPGRFALRDHRKLLLVDGGLAFVGGCNLADEYNGDGVNSGWRDGGMSITGPVVAALQQEFAAQWRRADEAQWRLVRGGYARMADSDPKVQALFMKPGLGASPLRAALRADLARARDIAITTAYFLPTRRLLGQLIQADRRGARVRLLLAGRSDVGLMLLAGQSLYRRLIQGGVEIFEYQPQVLHAKSIILDDVVYSGSSNLDPRSLRLNFEVMLRVEDPTLAAQARADFVRDLGHSRAVTPTLSWLSWSGWTRLKQRAAHALLARLDPWIAREQIRRL
jgi:cardiolipin synthase A/B